MIMLLGDIHGRSSVLKNAIAKAEAAGATALIQVGDFGLSGYNDHYFRHALKNAKIPVYFVDGNHDDCSRWTTFDTVHQVWDDRNLFYIPRGTVMELDGRTIAFMGGAGSIDKHLRIARGIHWDEQENISSDEETRMMTNTNGKTIDMFITHCPPNSVINENFNPTNKLKFGVGLDWHDPNQDVIQRLWEQMDYPMVYSGHMHRTVKGMTYRILAIDELVEV